MNHKEPESIEELIFTLKKLFTKMTFRVVEGAAFYLLLYIFAYITTAIMDYFPPYLFKDVADDQTFQSWMIYVKKGLNYFTLFVFALYVIHVLQSTALDILRRIISDTISFGQWLLDLKNRRTEPLLIPNRISAFSGHKSVFSNENKFESERVDDLEGLRSRNPTMLSSSGEDNDK